MTAVRLREDVEQLAPPRRRGRRARGVLVAVATVLVAALAVVGSTFGSAIVATLTHRVGGPSQTWEVVPLPPDAQPDLRVAIVGDIGEQGRRTVDTALAIAAQSEVDRYDVLMLLGDNVYPAGDPDELQAVVYDQFAPVLGGGTDLFAILGNHDVTEDNGDAQMEALGMPGRWYAERRGDLLGIALDSTDPHNPEQLAWLEETLATSDATWKLVALHHPPYSSGYHGSTVDGQEVFVPLFEEHGVQVVFSGHEHDYQRTDPINGVTYIVSGAGTLTRRTGIEDFTAVAYSTHHYVDLNVYEDHILLRAIDQDGEQFDEVVIPVAIP